MCSVPGSKVYEADFVIVTLPLGVLKENTVTFLPALSKEKTDAIKSVGVSELSQKYFLMHCIFIYFKLIILEPS